MNADSLLTTLLESTNEILTSATVIIAISLLLYNLSRNLRNRVTRTASIVLACVTWPYIGDAFLSLNPAPSIYSTVIRLQWLGIAFIPAALFHLSDALLETTGLPSRGRRRRIVRLLYLLSTMFFVAALASDVLIQPFVAGSRIGVRAGVLFSLYLIYFVVLSGVVFNNLRRARRRCLTRSTQRRMSYLQLAILTPAVGLFPFSVLLTPENVFSLTGLIFVNIANIIVIVMLIFLSYPLSFFGSDRPDRIVKTDLLRFLVRGPGTGLLALATIILTVDATRILSLPGEDVMPFAVVGVVLIWQWTIALMLPYLERWLIYSGEDRDNIVQIEDISERILTHSDTLQHLEATLSACCDILRTSIAFVVTLREGTLELVQSVGPRAMTEEALKQRQGELAAIIAHAQPDADPLSFVTWEVYQTAVLYNRRTGNGPLPIGLLLVETTPNRLPLDDDEQAHLLRQYIHRAEKTLDDMQLQGEVMAALEGLLPQISRRRDGEIEYRTTKPTIPLPEKDEIYDQVHAALRDYWGGPGITRSRLTDLKVVQDAITTNGSPMKALRAILQQALEAHRPLSERTMASPEWTLYNIIDLRYIEGKKVSDVARRLMLSEGDLYRKQRRAIEAITDTLIEMEQKALNV